MSRISLEWIQRSWVLAALPDDGPIEGADLSMLWGIAGVLADPRKLMSLASTYESDGAAGFIATIRPQPAPVITPPPAPAPTVTAVPPIMVAPFTAGQAASTVRPSGVASMPMPIIGAALPQPGFAALLGVPR